MIKYQIKILFFLILLPVLVSGQVYKSHTLQRDRLVIHLTEGSMHIIPVSDNAFRIQIEKEPLKELPELIFTEKPSAVKFNVIESDSFLSLNSVRLIAKFNKQFGTLSYADKSGKVFLKETDNGRKLIADSISGEPCYLAEQGFESSSDEKLFGLGQFQDGHFNINGISRRLTQVNTQISIPFLYSGKGYGLLWHQYGLTDYNPADSFISLERQELENNAQLAEVTTTSGTQKLSQNQSLYSGKFIVREDGMYSLFLDLGGMGNRHFVSIDGNPCIDQSNMWLPPTAGALVNLKAGEHLVQLICKSDNKPQLCWKLKDNKTVFRSPHAKKIDYVVFYGPSADSVIASYRQLSGAAPMFPLWAYGFWQCRERYTSGSHLVETVREFRKRKLPMDVIVQDWQYWGSKGWGVPQFDDTHYPDPSGFIKEIHDLNAHFNISIWSNPDKNSNIGKEYVTKNRFIPDTKWLDYFNPDTRTEYWKTLNENLFVHGVDSWWMDATEPENDALKGEKTYLGAGDFFRLTYPLMVSRAVYEGQRELTSEKRVCILTRSGFSGQQKYGIINWSGDIGGTWDAYKRQIVAGLNYTITGFPYWTTDIGGFFRPGVSQYTDERYHELLVRWFQWGVFNPVFRVHGYMSETEPWKYGQKVENNMREMLNLRYRLLPYIYSEAWQITKNGSTLMRPLVMDFPGDSVAVNQPYEYMFGKAFLVAPVTEPDAFEWNVYLPKYELWFDFWSGKSYTGGQRVKTEAPINKIPLYVKAGSIVPMGKSVQYAGERIADTLEFYVFSGNDGNFELYEDETDNYNYENGMHSIINFSWNDKNKILTINQRKGTFKGMISERKFNIILVEKNNSNFPNAPVVVQYSGAKISVKL